MIVVSDTGPVNYLVLIGHVDLLRHLYGVLIIPQAVYDELVCDEAPQPVRDWIEERPDWVEVQQAAVVQHRRGLDRGEEEAIALALSLNADLILMDEKRGRAVAADRGLKVAGTLAVLAHGAAIGAVALPEAVERLRQTSFHISERLMAAVLSLGTKRP